MNPRIHLLLALSALLLLWSPNAWAAVPDTIDYQGEVLGPDGQPLSPGTPTNYSMTFAIYNDLTGGSSVWKESQIVTVVDGKFSVRLGEGLPVGAEPRPPLKSVFTSSPKFLGLTVVVPGQPGTPGEIAPRLSFLSTPFAFSAEFAGTAAKADQATVAERINQTTGTSTLGTATIQQAIVNDTLTATGQVSAGEFSTSGKVAAGELTASGQATVGSLSASGNVTAAQFVGSGAQLTNLNASTLTGQLPPASMPDALSKPLRMNGNALQLDQVGSNASALQGSADGRTAILYATSSGSLSIHTPGVVFSPVFQFEGGGRGGVTVSAHAKPNDDKFSYDIYVAGIGAPAAARGTDITTGRTEGELRIARRDTSVHFWVSPTGWGGSSDRRLKRDIQPLAPALDGVLRLKPVSFFWKGEVARPGTLPSSGFIAQDVEPVFPSLVSSEEDGYLRVKYSDFPALLVSAIQALHEQTASENLSLKGEIEELRSENDSLREGLKDLSDRLRKLEAARP